MPRHFLRDDDLAPAGRPEVLDLAGASVVWGQAENRLHAQKALLARPLEHPGRPA